MRIGYFVPFLDPRPAGVGIYIDEVGKRLCAREPDTIIYAPRPEVMPSWLRPEQLRTLPSGMPRLGLAGGQRRLGRLAWLAAGAKRAAIRDQLSVFFSPAPEAPVAMPVPTVMVIHDLTVLRYPEAYQRSTVLQTRHLLPLMAKRVTRLVAVSENTKKDLVADLALDPARIDVVGEGFDAQTFFPRSAEDVAALKQRFELDAPFLLYAGTLSRHKNLKVVLAALAALKDEFPSLEFVMAGRRDVGVGTELDAEAARLGISKRVRSLGYVSRSELATLMSACAAFVYPSRYEGFGLAPLEAMAAGAPVVATRVASLPEVVGTGGELVPEGQAWAEPIARVLRADRGELARRARQQAEQFDWDRAVDQLLGVLRGVQGVGR